MFYIIHTKSGSDSLALYFLTFYEITLLIYWKNTRKIAGYNLLVYTAASARPFINFLNQMRPARRKVCPTTGWLFYCWEKDFHDTWFRLCYRIYFLIARCIQLNSNNLHTKRYDLCVIGRYSIVKFCWGV